jgi:hypothetical protein
MDGERLRKILCLMEPGMSLTAPDDWVDDSVTGSRIERARRVQKMAQDFGCIWKQGDGVQTFEKQEVWATG